MALSKKDRQLLENVLYNVNRVEAYLSRPDVAGIAHETKFPNGGDYQLINPVCNTVQAVTVMCKDCGSDIVGIFDAKKVLTRFLEADRQKRLKEA